MKKSRITEINVLRVIQDILIKEFGSIIFKHKGSAYSKFLLIAVGIEFLGACLDEFKFEESRQSENRFNKALKNLFQKKYHKYAKKSSEVYFFRELRSGFVHQFRPGKNIALTHQDESYREGTKHLQRIENGKLVLVLEDFYNDFEKACNKLIEGFAKGTITNKKGDKDFLVYSNIENNKQPN